MRDQSLQLEVRRLPGAGEEAAQIQSRALGRDRPRRSSPSTPPASASIAGLSRRCADDAGWKELCYLWSSDFRTHITEKRWTAFCARLARRRKSAGACDAGAPLRLTLARGGEVLPKRVTSTSKRRSLTARARSPARAGDREPAFAGDAQPVDRRPAAWTFRRHRAAGRLVHGRLRVRGAGRAQGHRSGMVRGARRERDRTATPSSPPASRRRKGRSKRPMRFSCERTARRFRSHVSTGAIGAKAALRLGHFTLLPDAFDWDDAFLNDAQWR